ncbi:MAG: amino acid ABC transporter substrate-binding protein [Aerococcaceae bacterium]|nr:amino acid ABC transporter substrate-binding protein [Aerococcaceae bacterium]
MKKYLKWMMAVLCLGMYVSIAAQAAKTIEPNQEIIIGLDDTFAPFGFKNDQNELVGFDIDLAKEIFGRMGVAYKFQAIDWSTKETELNSGNIDAIWNGYTVTTQREKVVAFSAPYINNRQIILVKKDSSYMKKADLEGKVVATQAESASLDAIEADADFVAMIDGGAPITYATFVEVFSDLDNGRADAIVVDETLATYYLSQRNDANTYRILEENFGEEQYGVGFRKSDQAFVEKFNATLKEVQADGTFDKIKAKWFKSVE